MALLGEDEYRQLIENANLLEQLKNHPGWPVLVDWLERRMLGDKKAILNGAVASLEDYAGRSGRCVGATWALTAAADVQQLVTNERERRTEAQEVAE